MNARRGLALIWLAFIARGFFYCAFQPLWEGYDEYAHFAYIERMATTGRLLIGRTEPAARDVEESMKLAPLPWDLRNAAPPSMIEDTYWQLPPAARARRERELRAMPLAWQRESDPDGPAIYEALQPPLYYWLFAGLYRAVETAPLTDRVYFLRIMGMLLASFAIPAVFLVARRATDDAALGLGAAALLALMPELAVDVCRVGNECAGVVLFSWLTVLAMDRRGRGILAGLLLGLGLIAKAYFLTALAAMALLLAWRTIAVAVAIGGWWYARNRVTTGTWSGLNESVMLRHVTLPGMVAGIGRVDWRSAIGSILTSHLWFGAQSGLVARGWMYRALLLLAAIAAAGVFVRLRGSVTQRRVLYPLLALYGVFWVGQLYNVLLLFLSKGASTSMGWYMYAVVAAELGLALAGLKALTPAGLRMRALAVPVVGFAALDLYTVHMVSIPYYTGFNAHRADGLLPAFHVRGLAALPEMLARLGVNAGVAAAAWIGYLAGTILLVLLVVRAARNENRPTQTPSF